MLKETKKIKDIRFASIIYHAFVEYYINELICLKFTKAKLIIDNIVTGSFFNKYQILKALEIFKKLENKDKLEKNIEVLTSIRNYYAHNLVTSAELPDKIKNHIEQLTIFNIINYKTMDSIPIKKSRKGYELKFSLCAISTIVFLHKIVMANKDLKEFADFNNSKTYQKIQKLTSL